MTDMTMYRVETRGQWGWAPIPNSEAQTRGEAEDLIADLREIDEEWSAGEYRIVEVDPPA